MNYAIIEGAAVGSMDRLHRLLAEQLDFPSWYGGNLDALYDCLTDLAEETSIILFHSQALAETLGPGYGRLCRVLEDAAAENTRLHIQI
ncbi:barstar family protein [Dysosmobacter sp.]|uniref:barstar family protein n=1 Tax=Dysosmobacter sp. TaxID=2591382 RepID=UPI002AA0AB83|nr:barstar family protein [Dysosmobacter sp.]MDY5612973.1 barstar family protein [Dysosmobacter sp.]